MVRPQADYNSLKSSLVQFEERASLTKFNTYSEIIINRYTFDDINVKELQEMVQQLVALAEFSFQDAKDGNKRKYNVKLQIQAVLQNDKSSTSLKIADCLLDQMVE